MSVKSTQVVGGSFNLKTYSLKKSGTLKMYYEYLCQTVETSPIGYEVHLKDECLKLCEYLNRNDWNVRKYTLVFSVV